jgi:hypothetical protein
VSRWHQKHLQGSQSYAETGSLLIEPMDDFPQADFSILIVRIADGPEVMGLFHESRSDASLFHLTRFCRAGLLRSDVKVSTS